MQTDRPKAVPVDFDCFQYLTENFGKAQQFVHSLTAAGSRDGTRWEGGTPVDGTDDTTGDGIDGTIRGTLVAG